MSALPPEQALLTRDRRWRQWMIRLALAVLLSMITGLVAVVFTICAQSKTIQEASGDLHRLYIGESRQEVEQVMGQPHLVRTVDGQTILSWKYFRQTIEMIEGAIFYVMLDKDGRMTSMTTSCLAANGWDAWKVRWEILQERLEFK